MAVPAVTDPSTPPSPSPPSPSPPPSPPPPRARYALAAAALVALAVGAVLLASRTDPATVGLGRPDPNNLPVGPAVPGLDGATSWLNSPALGASDLSGKVVVYDFWTYTCVNCVRTIPYLRSWYERYARDGLVIVGVHTPEFEFEKVRSNVEDATRRLGVTWPVAIDNGHRVWDAFNNQYWPAKYVADRQGRVRFVHFGEGAYDQTEDVLRALLGVESGAPRAELGVRSPAAQPDAGSATRETITAETYLGVLRGRTGARRGASTYPEPGPLRLGESRLVGEWTADEQSVTAGAAGSAVVLQYRAREVNLVFTPPAGTGAASPADVVVEVDGQPLAPGYRTADTVVEASGATVVRVDHSDLFRLVLGPSVEEHTLRLTFRTPGLAAFAFTFGD